MSDTENDDFLRGYHGIPDDAKLRAMSDIELDSLFDSSRNEPVKAAAIQREIGRRVPWYQKPLGITVLAVPSGLLVAVLAFLFGWN